jgi:hypothetical protein
MSYFIIGGTNVAVGQKSGGRNVGGRNVCGTYYVCRTKVAPPNKQPLTETKYLLSSYLILGQYETN